MATTSSTTCVRTKAAKTGVMAATDSFTPRMLRMMSTAMAPISMATLVRCTGSSQVPMSSAASAVAARPNHSRGMR